MEVEASHTARVRVLIIDFMWLELVYEYEVQLGHNFNELPSTGTMYVGPSLQQTKAANAE